MIDTLVEAPAERRTGLFVKALLAINGLWIAMVAVYALGRWLVVGDPVSWSTALFVATYTLIPSLLFIPAYVLWRIMDRRQTREKRVPLQLD